MLIGFMQQRKFLCPILVQRSPSKRLVLRPWAEIQSKQSSVQHNLNEKRAGRGPGRAALGAGAKEPLNQSSSAQCRIFCPIRALQKVGNPYRIPPLFEGSAEAKSLGIRACRLNQSFPSLQRLPGRLLWFLSCRNKKGTPPAGVGEHLSAESAKPLCRFPVCFPGSGIKICTKLRKPDKQNRINSPGAAWGIFLLTRTARPAEGSARPPPPPA